MGLEAVGHKMDLQWYIFPKVQVPRTIWHWESLKNSNHSERSLKLHWKSLYENENPTEIFCSSQWNLSDDIFNCYSVSPYDHINNITENFSVLPILSVLLIFSATLFFQCHRCLYIQTLTISSSYIIIQSESIKTLYLQKCL